MADSDGFGHPAMLPNLRGSSGKAPGHNTALLLLQLVLAVGLQGSVRRNSFLSYSNIKHILGIPKEAVVIMRKKK